MGLEPNLRERLIEVATDVFSLKGYASSNLADVSDLLGVSRGPIYYYFKDKYGLYKETFDRWETLLRETHGLIIDRKDCAILEKLGLTISNCLNHCRKYKANYFVGLDSLGELAVLNGRYHRLVTDLYEAKLAAVEEAMDRGELGRGLTPQQIVAAVYVVYDGIRVGIDRQDALLTADSIPGLIELLVAALGEGCKTPGKS